MELTSLARNPVPSGGTAGTFPGYDGTKLRFALWYATRGPRRGTVVCFTGRGEFIEKYFEVIADLRRRGFAVAIMDWRGQGGSARALRDPRKCHVRDFSEYDKDLACFMREVVLPDAPPPFIALAHSTGGNVLIRNSAMAGSWFERMVLTAPFIQLHADQCKFGRSATRLYAEVLAATWWGTSYVLGGDGKGGIDVPFEENTLTCDRERYSRNIAVMRAAPDLVTGSPTVAWLRAALRSCEMIGDPAFADKVRVPMLMFVAGKDVIVSQQAIEDFASRTKLGTHVILPDARHEILQETDAVRARFWAAFDAYLGVNEAAA
ncbi:MAG: hypothetical protein RLZ98_3539 [Pseudomonadota bacterium]|jgi:lysophospholipase